MSQFFAFLNGHLMNKYILDIQEYSSKLKKTLKYIKYIKNIKSLVTHSQLENSLIYSKKIQENSASSEGSC